MITIVYQDLEDDMAGTTQRSKVGLCHQSAIFIAYLREISCQLG